MRPERVTSLHVSLLASLPSAVASPWWSFIAAVDFAHSSQWGGEPILYCRMQDVRGLAGVCRRDRNIWLNWLVELPVYRSTINTALICHWIKAGPSTTRCDKPSGGLSIRQDTTRSPPKMKRMTVGSHFKELVPYRGVFSFCLVVWNELSPRTSISYHQPVATAQRPILSRIYLMPAVLSSRHCSRSVMQVCVCLHNNFRKKILLTKTCDGAIHLAYFAEHPYTPWVKKTRHQTLTHNFTKY